MMGITKKCGLFAALFAVFSIGLSGVFSSSANAWVTPQSDLPSCSETINITTMTDAIHRTHPSWSATSGSWLLVKSSTNEILFFYQPDTEITRDSVTFLAGDGFKHYFYKFTSEPGAFFGIYDPGYPWFSPSGFGSSIESVYPNFHEGTLNDNQDFTCIYDSYSVGIQEPDSFLYPQYEWKITNKKLNIKYVGNIPHFLTGINTIVIEKWAFNWETDTNEIIETIIENPAGWTNSEYDLTTDGAGYYTVRITHNQQLDSPPWEANANELYYIAPIFIRINWDGSSNRAGTTAGCAENNAVCGDVKEGEGSASNPLYGMFNALSNLELHGLTNFLLAPINFIGTLPSKVSSCTPISYPLFGTTQTLPCLRPMYEQYAVIYGLWQTIINGVVIGLVSMNIFRIVKNINTPTQDGIEVARL